jgi:hypothetical protein
MGDQVEAQRSAVDQRHRGFDARIFAQPPDCVHSQSVVTVKKVSEAQYQYAAAHFSTNSAVASARSSSPSGITL